jgi:hypothetical protein
VKDVVVVEGVIGYWFYHLAPPDRKHEALCGARTMSCGVPLKDWGFPGHPGHIRYRYCKTCAADAGIATPVRDSSSLDTRDLPHEAGG